MRGGWRKEEEEEEEEKKKEKKRKREGRECPTALTGSWGGDWPEGGKAGFLLAGRMFTASSRGQSERGYSL